MSRQYRNSGYEPLEDTSQRLENLNQTDACFTIYGFKKDKTRTVFYHVFSTLLLGIPYLFFFWYPRYKVIKFKKCSLKTSNIILFSDNFIKYTVIDVKSDLLNIPSMGNIELRYFLYQHTKYVWIENLQCFGTLYDLIPGITLTELLDYSSGLLEQEEQRLLKLYGPNTIEVEVKSYWKLFIDEVFNPYYIFQAFSVTLWACDNYIIYAGCIVLLTLFSAITALIETRKQSKALHDLVASSVSGHVQIQRRHLLESTFKIDPTVLVPGDILIIPRTGCIMPCDAALITGQSIVNESMLTGESVPVTKTPPHDGTEIYDPSLHKRHTLFSGTHVIQARFYGGEHVLARVVRTGFDTTKGSLVKSIMYPTPVGLKFYKDSLKFILCLFVIAATGMCYSLYLYISRNAEVSEMIIRTLDIITIVVPPALPAALTVATVYSQNRLKKLGIFCISPPRINVCGKLKLACFDKTGTLTHEGLDLYSVMTAENSNFCEPISDPQLLDLKHPFLQAMATCHSLTRVDGTLTGDPLDLNMFENTHWELEEPGSEENTRYDMLGPTIVKPKNITYANIAGGDSEMPYEIGIIRQFSFSSSLQCMSVICRELGDPYMTAYTKGAPEKVFSLCNTETLPRDFSRRLSQFTASGFRVIAVAYKKLAQDFNWKAAQKIKRDTIECELNFLGFIIMQNTLKPETTPVISLLHDANIRSVMITGDNVETAISVARDCGMVKVYDKVALIKTETDVNNDSAPKIFYESIGVDSVTETLGINMDNTHAHFAMDGKTWSKLCAFYPDLLPLFLLRTTVFARFQPDQKTQLVTYFQKLDYIVCMVGDGANDCGALKAAHVGVSLSQTEASVAAPFTSTIDNISCIIHLMLEGRCALVTSFAEIKYMAMYSLIQFFTVLILYKQRSVLGDLQFLFIDLIITTSFALTIGRQGPSLTLVPTRPMGSLISGMNLVPMLLQVLLCGAVQLGALYFLKTQPWYSPVPPTEDEVIMCWETTVLFTVSCFQYIIMAVLYSKGKPYREMLITNFWLLFTALTLTSFCTYLCIYPSKWIAKLFELQYLPDKQEYHKRVFRYMLLIFPVAHFFIGAFIELCISESSWLKKLIHFVMMKKKPKNKYKLLIKENDFDSWFNDESGSNYITPPQSICV